MKLELNDGEYACGIYGTVFFRDGQAIKVFKRRDTLRNNSKVRKTFDSECKAYSTALSIDEIKGYVGHFIGKARVCKILDKYGEDISDKYILDCAYSMTKLDGDPIKIRDLEAGANNDKYTELMGRFRHYGIGHMTDCSLFLKDNGDVLGVIDFGMEEYPPSHAPLT